MRNWFWLALVFMGCERPFVEATKPSLQVVAPDLTKVQTSAVINIRVESAHFRALERVYLNGAPMEPAPPGPSYWQISVGLRLGLNRLFLDATDREGVSRKDTAYAVYLPHRISLNAPALPEGRGGHALVRLRDGSLMVTGGSRRQGDIARGESFLLTSNSGLFGQMKEGLRTPRTGHTASLLPDGRVLIVGGGRIDPPASITDLIESVEIYDPAAPERTFNELPVRGQPIRRMQHTAIVHQSNGEVLLDLVGGYGDTRYGSAPFLGVRRDLRTFRVDSDALVALNSAASAPFIFEPVAGHTATRASPDSYFILGSQFVNGTPMNGNLRIHYPRGFGMNFYMLPELLLPRTDHATAPLLSGMFAIFGGRLASSSMMATDMEIFHEATAQFFTLHPSQTMIARHNHTAISAGLRSALLVGGFNANGTAVAASEYVVVSSE